MGDGKRGGKSTNGSQSERQVPTVGSGIHHAHYRLFRFLELFSDSSLST